MSIHLFVPVFRIEECLAEIRDCLEKGWTGLGYKTVQFEEEWKRYTGLDNALFLNSATAGLDLAVRLLKMHYHWDDKSEIITTPFSFVSTNHAILHNGLNPVFADVDQFLCLDPGEIEKKLTHNTKAVMFVGLAGSTGQYEKVADICRKRKLKLILDAAHMAGTRLNGVIPGRKADVVVYSFQAVKNLPTADSGMICFRDPDLDSICRKMAWLGIDKDTYTRSSGKGAYKWKYEVEYLGHKYHGNSIMAAIGLVQLKYLDQDNAYRRQVAKWYDDLLKGYSDRIECIGPPGNCESSRHLYIISVGKRDELILALNENGIYPGVHYQDNTQYAMYSFAKGTCPLAHRMSNCVLSLPMHLKLTRQDVDFVSQKVVEYCGCSPSF